MIDDPLYEILGTPLSRDELRKVAVGAKLLLYFAMGFLSGLTFYHYVII
jgi:hypothetical protein